MHKEWREYVLISGVFVREGQKPEDVFLNIENGRVLLDMNVVGDNDEPVMEDTWLFDGFAFVAPGIYTPGCAGGMLEYEFANHMGTDVFAPHYNEIVELFRQHEENIRAEPEHCAASVFTQWHCVAKSSYHPETGTEWDSGWKLVGEFVLPQDHKG